MTVADGYAKYCADILILSPESNATRLISVWGILLSNLGEPVKKMKEKVIYLMNSIILMKTIWKKC